MANYKTLQFGSTGQEVEDLQNALKNKGYELDADGIFGSQTQNAVKQFQQASKLDVDGIVGTNTWDALNGTQEGSSAGASGSDGGTAATPEDTIPKYEQPYKASDAVTQAEALLQQHMDKRPGDYQSTWQGQLQDTIAQILNRDKFAYDLNADALYQQYKDQYVNQGKLAMMDAMGQASAMTGGYGNSYAQTAGQQAYQAYLQQLNNVVPELYGMALDQYNQEGQALYDQASLLAGMEDQEYGRYRDQLSDYYTELGLLTDDARYKAEQDYGRWADDRNFGYQQHRDQIADQQWQAQFDEAKRQYDEQVARSSSGGSVRYIVSGDEEYDTSGNSGALNEHGVKVIQQQLGVKTTGVWDAETQKKAYEQWGAKNANDAYVHYTGGVDKDLDGYMDKMSYDEIVAEYKMLKNGGFKQKDLDEYLQEREDNGEITSRQKAEIRDMRF